MKKILLLVLLIGILGWIVSWARPDYTRAGQKVLINDTDTATVEFERHFPKWMKIPTSVRVAYKDNAGIYQNEEFTIQLTKPLEENEGE